MNADSRLLEPLTRAAAAAIRAWRLDANTLAVDRNASNTSLGRR